MNILKRLWQEDGRARIDGVYTCNGSRGAGYLAWSKDTSVGDSLVKSWAKIIDCVGAPFSCSA